ncbi:MAG TPA: FAD-dependent oxidoreductase [Myxococcales bacterium]|nr:FAD-dependent oxidoreductase [Myxococcales bacterium]
MLKHLLSSTQIGGLKLRNRIAVAPMGVEIAEADGHVREPVIAYYEERARGGAGLIITENTSACYPRGANSAHELGVSNDGFLPGLRALTERVHAHGARIAIQLAHHGKVGRLDTQHGRPLLMPSTPRKKPGHGGPLDLSREEMGLMAAAAGNRRPTIQEATEEDLAELVEDFAAAAERAQRAGFDAVEIHGAHGYIFSEFLSPAWNFRQDQFGGAIENRARLLCETISACKAATGGAFPVWCRIDATEFGEDDGIRLEDAQLTAELAVKAGADAIHVSAYAHPLGAGFTQAPIVHAEGGFAGFAAAIKTRVTVPVIAVGRLSPEAGDRLIREGKADIIAMGRQMLADPATAQKLSDNRSDSIRPCIYCYTCVAQAFFDRSVRCAVNPVTAHEADLAQRMREKSPHPQRVLIAGGGPAGLEAARVAAMRGHRVTLYEKGDQLGGTLRFAALVYEPNERLLNWLEGQVRELGVEILLGRELSFEDVRQQQPDHVIVAAGARRENPSIPGSDLAHVMDGDTLRALLTGEASSAGSQSLGAFDRFVIAAGRRLGVMRSPRRLRVLSHRYMPIGERVVIIGGGLVGIELAEFLAARNRQVTVLEEGEIFALQMAHPRRWRVLHDVRKAGVELVGRARVDRITERSVDFSVSADDDKVETRSVEAASVIVTLGLEPNPDLAARLKSSNARVVSVGDCTGVGYIEGAIREGFEAALALDSSDA